MASQRNLAASLRQPLLDLAIFFMAALLALSFGVTSAQGAATQHLSQAAAIAVMLLAINAVFGVYRHPSPAASWAVVRTGLLLALGVPLAALLLQVFPAADLPQAQFGYVVLFTWAALVPARPLARPRVRTGRRGWHVLFVGAHGAALIDECRMAERFDRRLVMDLLRSDGRFSTSAGWRIVPRDAPLAEVVGRHRISEIVVVPRQQRGGVLPLQQLLQCRIGGVPVVDLADFVERRWGELAVETMKASRLIYCDGFRQGMARRALKRGFDVVVAVSVLAAASLPIGMAALVLRVQGIALIVERRLCAGRGGRGFEQFSLRMRATVARQDADSSRSDARYLMRGRQGWLKLPLEWLASLLNVLRGDMSIVGPRAIEVAEAAVMRERFAFYGLRFGVKPGLLSWAEVGRERGSLPDVSQELARDLYYAKHHSLMLDLLILLEHARSLLYGGRSLTDRWNGDAGHGRTDLVASRADGPS